MLASWVALAPLPAVDLDFQNIKVPDMLMRAEKPAIIQLVLAVYQETYTLALENGWKLFIPQFTEDLKRGYI